MSDSLAFELDQALLAWLADYADSGQTYSGSDQMTCIIWVAGRWADEVEDFARRWHLKVTSCASRHIGWQLLTVSGQRLPVEGLAVLADNFRRHLS